MLELIVEYDRPLSNWNLRKDNTDQHKVLPNAKLPTVVHWRENNAGTFLYTVHFHETCDEDIRYSLYSSAWIRKWWQMKTLDLCGLRSVMLLRLNTWNKQMPYFHHVFQSLELWLLLVQLHHSIAVVKWHNNPHTPLQAVTGARGRGGHLHAIVSIYWS